MQDAKCRMQNAECRMKTKINLLTVLTFLEKSLIIKKRKKCAEKNGAGRWI